MIGSVRRHVHIERSADDVWRLVGDPARVQEWFPGIVGSVVDGSSRVVTLGSGMQMPEEILVNDPIQRRFQYTLALPVITHHRGTIDVLDMGDGTCVAVYATDADPRTMALMIGAAGGNALLELKRIVEAAPADPTEPPGA